MPERIAMAIVSTAISMSMIPMARLGRLPSSTPIDDTTAAEAVANAGSSTETLAVALGSNASVLAAVSNRNLA
jgi:hypothetical protein